VVENGRSGIGNRGLKIGGERSGRAGRFQRRRAWRKMGRDFMAVVRPLGWDDTAYAHSMS